MRNPKVKYLVLCALFAALTAILSQIMIPIGPVPINLALFAVILAGGLLGPKFGTVSQAVYVLLGLVGFPVFHGFSGGIGIVMGPTGGYIWGYIAAAWIVGLLVGRFGKKLWQIWLCMAAGIAACYTLGTAWFVISTGTGWIESLMICVVPFLLGDALKIIAAGLLTTKLRKLDFLKRGLATD